MDTTIWSISGLLGVAFYLSAYGALQFGIIKGSSVTYTVLNMIAAMLVLISLVDAFNLSSMLIQVSWITLSVIGLARLAWLKSRTRFDENERALLSAHFSTLPPLMARRVLSMGRWHSASPGTVLTRQGTAVHQLTYIAEGRAEVRAHGSLVAEVGRGALIGEMTILHGGEATADVEITEPARIFSLPRGTLVREIASDHELAVALSQALQVEALRKFDAANRRVAGLPPAGDAAAPIGEIIEAARPDANAPVPERDPAE